MKALAGEYYAECNTLFRQVSSQGGLMLDKLRRLCQGFDRLRILSVGSGAGVFELRMLRSLREQGIEIQSFQGIDIDPAACEILRAKLRLEFQDEFPYRVGLSSFEDFTSEGLVDLVLFNHTFEYLRGDYLKWVNKAREMLSPGGMLLIFSPNRGGINQIYARQGAQAMGYQPLFSEELESMLDHNDIDYEAEVIEAECDLSLLLEGADTSEQTKLLSFLTQIDCRHVGRAVRAQFIHHFRSMTSTNSHRIPHPTTLIALRA